jgi:elongation factor 2 kinase
VSFDSFLFLSLSFVIIVLLFVSLSLKHAAAKAVAEEDPWAAFHIEKYPAERVVRHLYHPETGKWSTDETIVKMELDSFTNGAMRFCYRMKKRSPPPRSASNHRFHNYGWTRASNFVAKAYHKDGQIDTSDDAKDAVRNDILLQYEAAYHAEKFNEQNPPKKIVFIRAYAIEFPNRTGSPWFAVERFIAGTDSYGCGFTKHNTNAGFVDQDLHRVTPQVFSAHSFYKSEGERLVADIQGVGDLYTDPQVLSSDYRFGEGDLGPRGMALFFLTFQHTTLADSLGIPVFPLSKNELKHQAKYEDDVYSLSDMSSNHEELKGLNRFARLDFNRKSRMSVFDIPIDFRLGAGVGGGQEQQLLQDDTTQKRSNQTTREEVSKSLRKSMKLRKPSLHRTSSEVDEVKRCLELAKQDLTLDHKAYRRKASGEMAATQAPDTKKRPSLAFKTVSEPILPTDQTRLNLGKVHHQLAVLHGMCRFPEVVPLQPGQSPADAPAHDVFSVLFHLSHASALHNVPACLALGRVHAGLGSCVSDLLQHMATIDFDAAKTLLRRAMDSPFPPSNPKAAAGCLLYQILLDDGDASDTTISHLLEDTIKLLEASKAEAEVLAAHRKKMENGGGRKFAVGDRVEADYCLEGTYYPGVVEQVSEDGKLVTVRYDDDGSTESQSLEHVKLIVPPSATQTLLGGPLSDEDLFADNTDEKCLMEAYELKGELADFKEKAGDKQGAAKLFEESADDAMKAGKMQKATKWSLRAAELLD